MKFGKILTYRDTEEAKKYIGKMCCVTDFLEVAKDLEGREVKPCSPNIRIRRWHSNEWILPTIEVYKEDCLTRR